MGRGSRGIGRGARIGCRAGRIGRIGSKARRIGWLWLSPRVGNLARMRHVTLYQKLPINQVL